MLYEFCPVSKVCVIAIQCLKHKISRRNSCHLLENISQLAISRALIFPNTLLYQSIQFGCISYFSINSFYFKLLISESKFPGTRIFTLRYQ